jgi:acyl-CoA reductase-like NAD-dependent aldehyde dehydrogenase
MQKTAFDQALDIANDTEFGMTCAVCSSSREIWIAPCASSTSATCI